MTTNAVPAEPDRRAREQALFDELVRSRDIPERATQAQAARDELIVMHDGLVRHLARHFRAGAQPSDDLLQAGMLGLITAVDRFDPSLGNAFTSFAVPHINGEMRALIRSQSWSVKAPRRLKDLHSAVNATINRLQADGSRPTVAQIAEALGVEPTDVVEALDLSEARTAQSLDVPITDTGSPAAESIGAEDPAFALVELRATIGTVLERLPPEERAAVIGKFFEDRTQEQIAAQLGTNQVRVSRLLARAMARLRSELDEPDERTEAS